MSNQKNEDKNETLALKKTNQDNQNIKQEQSKAPLPMPETPIKQIDKDEKKAPAQGEPATLEPKTKNNKKEEDKESKKEGLEAIMEDLTNWVRSKSLDPYEKKIQDKLSQFKDKAKEAIINSPDTIKDLANNFKTKMNQLLTNNPLEQAKKPQDSAQSSKKMKAEIQETAQKDKSHSEKDAIKSLLSEDLNKEQKHEDEKKDKGLTN